MTMPQVAAVIRELGSKLPGEMTDAELDKVIDALRVDLPGVVEFTDQAAVACLAADGAFTTSVRTIDQLGREEWNGLVSRLARLYASPFSALPAEWLRRRGDLAVAFVNCCMLVVQRSAVDPNRLYTEQISNQLTPDC